MDLLSFVDLNYVYIINCTHIYCTVYTRDFKIINCYIEINVSTKLSNKCTLVLRLQLVSFI